MTTVVAMLRGINVSGRNKVPMAGLRSTAESLGYTGVRSYVQSGNLVFDAPGRATPASVAATDQARRSVAWGERSTSRRCSSTRTT